MMGENTRRSFWLFTVSLLFSACGLFDNSLVEKQRAEIESLHHNETAQKWFAQNYVGLPY